MKLESIDVTTSADAQAAVAELMDAVFPEAERLPIDSLVRGAQDAPVAFRAFYAEGEFAGFALWIWQGDLAYVLYLAVSPTAQSHGVGSAILDAVKADREGDRLFLEMESVAVPCDNREQRERRLRFYNRNGFEQTGLHSRDAGVDYDILSCGGAGTADEYRAFFAQFPVVADGEILVYE